MLTAAPQMSNALPEVPAINGPEWIPMRIFHGILIISSLLTRRRLYSVELPNPKC